MEAKELVAIGSNRIRILVQRLRILPIFICYVNNLSNMVARCLDRGVTKNNSCGAHRGLIFDRTSLTVTKAVTMRQN